jgi:hypothetical protein
MKKPFSFNSDEKAVSIQPSRKSRPHPTQPKKQMKKLFPFNPDEKVVPIQPR